MKKIIACIFAVSIIFSGCSMQNIKDEVKEEVSDVKEDVKELKDDAKNIFNGKLTDAEFIGEEKAKEIALKKAGIKDEGIIYDRTEFESDGGRWIYEIDFKKDLAEYEADIDALTGEIISWSVDKN
ncbi:MAG: hypothetical protein E7407_04375 [Ruminococcaceae bacterium]|nr:hypothetical protein [Oscillospiraceae bacterium]